MSRRKDEHLLDDVIESITRIQNYTQGINYQGFREDIKTQDAVMRNIEIIGEAVRNLSSDLKDNNPTVPWKEISGTRDKLIHDYFGVNIDVVWGIIELDLPDLTDRIATIRKELSSG